MAKNNLRNTQHQLTANMVAALEDSTDGTNRLVDPITRLSVNTGDLKNVQLDNLNEVRYLRNTILQSNNVLNKGTEVVKKADRINVKALGQSVTLQKIINENSTAINNSSVGYLRAAEAFIDNFAAGIRKTEGGTLRLTEQLILTGQNQQSFRDVNNNLLGATGRNYEALGSFNDSVIQSAKDYQMATGDLLEGIKKLQGDINQFALFGPEVASNLSEVFADVKGSFQGLGEEQIGSFMNLFKGGLSTRPTRELLGIQQFAEDMARGAISADETRAKMVSVGQQMSEATRGMEFDVAVDTLKAMYSLSQQDASNLVMLKDIAVAGPSNDRKLLSTAEDNQKTLKNQTELANKYYEKIAPMTLDAVTNLMLPLIQISQGVNLFAAVQTGSKSFLNLAGGAIPAKSQKAMTKLTHSNILTNKGQVAHSAYLNTFNTKSTGAIKNLTEAIKTRMPRNFGSAFKSPMGVGMLGMGAAALGQGLGGQETTAGKLLGSAGDHLGNVAMARMLVPKLPTSAKLLGGGLGFSLAGEALSMAKTGLGIEEKEGLDAGDAMDVGSMALKGAGMGSIFGVAGMAVGGALGGLYGLFSEYMEDDSKNSKSMLELAKKRELKEEKEKASDARMRAATQRSDFILMGIVDRVRKSESNLAGSDSKQVAELLQDIKDLHIKRNRDANMSETGKQGDLNGG